MVDIQSPSFAEKISALLDVAKKDETVKKSLLNDPEKFLAGHGITLNNYQIIVEETLRYGLFFALMPRNNTPSNNTTPLDSLNSGIDLNFLDCLHY